MIDPDQFWERSDDARPGVTETQIQAWEQQQGVTLPTLLRETLTRQNGGLVRLGEIEIDPLREIRPVDEDFWDYTDIDDDEAPDHALVFSLGSNDLGGQLLMNFNKDGRKGEPSLYLFYSDPGDATLIADSLDEFFEAELAFDDEPAVDWSEWTENLAIVARETIDMSAPDEGKADMEQVLVRQDDALVLFTRTRFSKGENLEKTTLPLPLDPQWAEIRPLRPGVNPTFALHIQPKESDGILCVESFQIEDGRWKNTINEGAPIYVHFESSDRARLEALRTDLFGQAEAECAQAMQDREASLQAHLDSLPPEQRQAAMLQAAMTMKADLDRQFAAQFGDLGPPPPELAPLANLLRQKLDQATARARDQVAHNPPSPETLQKIDEMFKPPD
ncbi:MAG: SMI1/KNR4 family protein [Isosphaeraceae bacterium]